MGICFIPSTAWEQHVALNNTPTVKALQQDHNSTNLISLTDCFSCLFILLSCHIKVYPGNEDKSHAPALMLHPDHILFGKKSVNTSLCIYIYIFMLTVKALFPRNSLKGVLIQSQVKRQDSVVSVCVLLIGPDFCFLFFLNAPVYEHMLVLENVRFVTSC